jgi:hypothetical protein
VTQLLLVVVLAAAIVVLARRRWRRARVRRLASRRPGASPEQAVPIDAFDEMDAHLRHRSCPCGGYLARRGEGSRDAAGRRYRVARLECLDCGRVDEVFFDTTDVAH